MGKKVAYDSNTLFTKELSLENIYTKEDLTDEHKMIADMTASFVEQDVLPVLPQVENQEFDQVINLVRKSGELGLLGVDIPEAYSGMELDKVSAIVITEEIAKARSFSITYSGQIGIGSLPIVYYGTEEQKKKYLPHVASGEMIGAYALTEPDAGTDALGIKTTAVLSEDGKHYIINGEKQFITNASFADFFVLYAKVDGDKFTAFIIDRDTDGITIGPEEEKMGLKGSSTTSIVLTDVKIPVENVLGEIGRGHLIAFNILNIGRHKISASCVGTAKRALELAVSHTTERKQFKQPLAEFNLTKEKLATMAADIFAMESMVYRTAGEFEAGATFAERENIPFLKILKAYAAECSINKVFASEALDRIVDESLQLHGGYGFIQEYEIETLYRDSRINRIFEGTNEINRIVIGNAILERLDDYLDERILKEAYSEQLIEEWEIYLRLREYAGQFAKYVKDTRENVQIEQELLVRIADFAILTYAIESSLLRVEKLLQKGSKNVEQQVRLAKLFVQEASKRYVNCALGVPSSDELNSKLSELVTLVNKNRMDAIELKREAANIAIRSV